MVVTHWQWISTSYKHTSKTLNYPFNTIKSESYHIYFFLCLLFELLFEETICVYLVQIFTLPCGWIIWYPLYQILSVSTRSIWNHFRTGVSYDSQRMNHETFHAPPCCCLNYYPIRCRHPWLSWTFHLALSLHCPFAQLFLVHIPVSLPVCTWD